MRNRSFWLLLGVVSIIGALMALQQACAFVNSEEPRDVLVSNNDMIEGRIGEWLSNGTWRVRVSKVEPTPNPFGRGQGFAATVEFRNITPNTISLHGSGLDKVLLLDDAGNQLSCADGSFQQKYRSIVRADGFTAELKFGDPNNQLSEVGQPDKLLIQFRQSGGKQPLKGFRIFLKEPTVQEGQ